jgi:hypothetical protein
LFGGKAAEDKSGDAEGLVGEWHGFDWRMW